jgi:hypothetical protein
LRGFHNAPIIFFPLEEADYFVTVISPII